MLQASRLPYDVPVFQAIFGKWAVVCQLNGKSGRLTLLRISLIIKAADALNTLVARSESLHENIRGAKKFSVAGKGGIHTGKLFQAGAAAAQDKRQTKLSLVLFYLAAIAQRQRLNQPVLSQQFKALHGRNIQRMLKRIFHTDITVEFPVIIFWRVSGVAHRHIVQYRLWRKQSLVHTKGI